MEWVAEQLQARKAPPTAAPRSPAINPNPPGTVQPGSRTDLALQALRAVRERAGERPERAWVTYGRLVRLMGLPRDAASVHWSLRLLLIRGQIDRRIRHARFYEYRLRADGATTKGGTR